MVVLVHGLGVSHRYFLRLRRLLPGALAPDLAGATVGELTQSLEAAVAPGSLLVANSLGCQVAVELAVRRPELVRALVLIGPTWDPSAPTLLAQALRLLQGIYREPPSLLPLIAYEYLLWGPRRLLRAGRGMLDHPIGDRLPLVVVPTVVVRGEGDSICSGPWALRVAAATRGRFVELPGAAHAVHWSRPEVVVELVEELLQDG